MASNPLLLFAFLNNLFHVFANYLAARLGLLVLSEHAMEVEGSANQEIKPRSQTEKLLRTPFSNKTG